MVAQHFALCPVATLDERLTSVELLAEVDLPAVCFFCFEEPQALCASSQK